MAFCTGALPVDRVACAALPQMSAIQSQIPDPVSFWSNTDIVAQQLGEASISTLYGIDGNDYLGNCVAEGTLVQGSGVHAGYKSKYSGPAILIVTASGKRLTVTPNHAVLTPSGFVKACLLNKGDNLVCTRRLDLSERPRGFDFNKPPTPVEQIVASLGRSRALAVMSRAINFHGDERFVDGNVEVVSANSFLNCEYNPALSEVEGHQKVMTAGMSKRRFHRDGSGFEGRKRGGTATLRGIGGRRIGLPLVSGESRIVSNGGFGSSASNAVISKLPDESSVGNSIFFSQPQRRFSIPVSLNGRRPLVASGFMEESSVHAQLRMVTSEYYASRHETFSDRTPIDSELSGKLFKGFPGVIFPDEIIEIERVRLDGHVYDLSTESNWYSANGVIVHNCTVAGAAHAITVQNGLIGTRVIPLAQDVINLYGQLGGRGMSGLNLTTVINAWQRGILGGNKIIAACNIDPSNTKAVKQAIQYFGGAYFAFDTTGQTEPQFQAGQPWTVTNSRLQGGHCVYATGFNDATGMYDVLTWGGLQLATYEWWDKFVTECHLVLAPSASVFTQETMANLQAAMPSLSA